MSKARKIIPPMIPFDDEDTVQVDQTVAGRLEYFASEVNTKWITEPQTELAAEPQARFIADKD